jgi:hypothetical protein
MEGKMKRFLLLAVLAVVLLPIGRHANAVPRYGHYYILYANACGNGPYLYSSMPGDYLGSDLYDCTSHVADGVLESELTGVYNWKQEWILDCETGAPVSHEWYIGGYRSWSLATPGNSCVYGG